MNNGTKIRTALRIVFSIYTAFCAWQVSITELGKQLHAPWLAALCAVIIVICGLLVDVLTTYFNNDYTEEAAIGTGVTRQLKAEKKDDYIGDFFFADYDQEYEEESNEDRGAEPINGIVEEDVDEADIVPANLEMVGEGDE